MLKPFRDDIWIACGPVSFLGLRLTVTMTVLRLPDGTLLVHSPLPWSVERQAEVTALGPVAHLYAPNTFHHQWLGDWITACPTARVHAPQELAAKRPDLRIDRFHDGPTAAQIDGVDEIPIRGFRLRESVLVHRAAGTAVVADLVHNIGRPEHTWTKLYTRAMGFYDRVALSRMLRWTSFDDRRAARASLSSLLDLEFDGLIVGHGEPLAHDGRELLAGATSWLDSVRGAPRRAGTSAARLFSPKPCG